jgi:phage-related protein
MAGPTRKDVRSFPRPVRRDIGIALYAAQHEELDPAARPMKGFGGSSVVEIVSDYRGDTWRAVYTVRFAEAVYSAACLPEEIEAWHCHAA